MVEQFANNATTSLNGSITSGATSLVVMSSSLFPSSGNFRVSIDGEIILVTGVSGTTWTVTRAQENTTAIAHNSGAAVTHILTAGALIQLKTDVVTTGTFASRPTAGVNGRIYYPTDGPISFIDDGTNWRPLVGGTILGTQPAAASTWNKLNFTQQGSQTAAPTLSDNFGTLKLVITGGTANLQGIYETMSAGTWTLTVALNMTSLVNFAAAGLFCSDGTKYVAQLTSYNSSIGGHSLDCNTYTSVSSGANVQQNYATQMGNIIWLRMQDDGTNINYYWSQNGIDFMEYRSVGRTSFLASAPTLRGVVLSGSATVANGGVVCTVLSYNVTNP